MTVEPSWPRTPSGSGKWPAMSQMARPEMNTATMTRFCTTRRPADRDRFTTAGIGEFVANDDGVGRFQVEV